VDQSALFEGSPSKFLSYDVDMLTRGQYYLAGQLIALSVRYDGPGPQCFHSGLYEAITPGPQCFHSGLYEAITQQTLRGVSLTVDLLPEGTTKDLLKQVL